jgi:acetyltransferase
MDYDLEIVLVAETSCQEIIAAGRPTHEHGTPDAEVAVLVPDHWQEHGLGTEKLRALIGIGKQERVRTMFGHILPEAPE